MTDEADDPYLCAMDILRAYPGSSWHRIRALIEAGEFGEPVSMIGTGRYVRKSAVDARIFESKGATRDFKARDKFRHNIPLDWILIHTIVRIFTRAGLPGPQPEEMDELRRILTRWAAEVATQKSRGPRKPKT